MSENPAYPDADKTAPGGMSRAELVDELVDEYGWERESDWDGTPWPQLIDWVVEERLAAEADPSDEDEDEDDPEVEAEELAEAEDGFRPEPDGADDTERIETEDEPMLDDPVFPSATRMFDDEGDDPMNEPWDDGEVRSNMAIVGADIEALMAELDGASVSVVEEVLHDAGVDSDVMDPEQMFAEMVAAREEEMSKQPPPLFLGIPGVKDYIFDGHAGAGPSGAERWMNCTMSLSASRKFLETLSPRQQVEFARAGTAARQGTTAHAAGEARANHMLGRVDDDELEMTLLELTVNPEHETEAYDDEMEDYVGEYVDLVRSYAQERGADAIEVEQRVEAAIPLTGMHEGEVYVVRGSADLTVLPVKKHKSLVVGDLKYGEGKDVDVDENPQIRLYALGVIGAYADEEGNIPSDFKRIEYIIAQPRLGGIKRWEESVDDLLEWRDEVLAPALTLALYGEPEGATYLPGELQCQWCPARGGCPALAESVMESGAELFTALSEAEYDLGPGQFPETESLSSDRLGELLTMAEDIDKLRKSLKEEAQRRLHRGEPVKGHKLVNYSPPRHWVSGLGETRYEIEAALKKAGATKKQIADMFTEPKLISPPAAEKALGKEGFPNVASLVVKPDPVPVIGRENDRRSEWKGKPPEQMFEDES